MTADVLVHVHAVCFQLKSWGIIMCFAERQTWYWVVVKQPMMLLLWCNIHGVNSTHRCHYTMAPADSKFDDLSDADIDSLTEDAISKNTR